MNKIWLSVLFGRPWRKLVIVILLASFFSFFGAGYWYLKRKKRAMLSIAIFVIYAILASISKTIESTENTFLSIFLGLIIADCWRICVSEKIKEKEDKIKQEINEKEDKIEQDEAEKQTLKTGLIRKKAARYQTKFIAKKAKKVVELNGEKKQKMSRVAEYLLKYLSDKDNEFKEEILLITKEPNLPIYEDSINSLKADTTEHLYNLLKIKKHALSQGKLDEFFIINKKLERRLDFLNDLEKFYEIFIKKSIKTDYHKILSILEELIAEEFDGLFASSLSETFEKVNNKLAGETNNETVLRACIRQSMTDKTFGIGFLFRLFDKFGLKYNAKEVARLLEKENKEVALEEFEENLGSAKKIHLEEFKDLDGHSFESWLEKLFKRLGYDVIKTPSSADQGADLIVSKNHEKMVVQAKKYEGKVANSAIQEVVASKKYYKVDKALVVTNSSFTKSAVDLAISNDVELWDGNKLKKIMESL